MAKSSNEEFKCTSIGGSQLEHSFSGNNRSYRCREPSDQRRIEAWRDTGVTHAPDPQATPKGAALGTGGPVGAGDGDQVVSKVWLDRSPGVRGLATGRPGLQWRALESPLIPVPARRHWHSGQGPLHCLNDGAPKTATTLSHRICRSRRVLLPARGGIQQRVVLRTSSSGRARSSTCSTVPIASIYRLRLVVRLCVSTLSVPPMQASVV